MNDVGAFEHIGATNGGKQNGKKQTEDIFDNSF
jgi:hypothetical protein